MKIKKNKFIIGLSTTVLGSALAAGSQVAYADEPAYIPDSTTTGVSETSNDNFAEVVDGSYLGGELVETPSEDNPQDKSVDEINSDTSTESTEGTEQNSSDTVLANETEEDSTNVTEKDSDAKVEAGAELSPDSEETNSNEEAVLTEPKTNDKDSVEEGPAEETEVQSKEAKTEEDTDAPATETDKIQDTEVEAGAVIEDGADTTSVEADTKKTQASEENTADINNKETADVANTEQKDDEKTSADAPQETPAGEGPDATTIAKLSIGKVENPLETDANVASTNDVVTQEDPLTGETDTADGSGDGDPDKEVEVDFGAETTSEEGEKELTIQTFALGNFPLTEEGAELPNPHLENINMLSADLVEAGAESSAGDVNIAVKEGYTDPEADAAKIENKRETNLTPGDTVESGGKNDFVDPKDGFQATVIEPKNDSKDKRLYGYEFIIDKKTGQRTYTRIEASSGVVRTSPATLGDKPMMEKGDKLSESSPEVTYKATGTSTLSPGSQNVYGYRASEEDLMHINNKDNDSTVLGMKDYYTRDNATGSKVLDNVNVVFNVNPWPDENDNLERIRLQGNYDENKKVYVHGQEIDTGLKVENLDENARDRLTAKVYNPENGEIVPGAEVYIDGEGNVKVKLPDGAVDTNGKINKKSIFYDDPKFNGAQSLDVKLYARPRKAEEFQNVANLSWFAPGTYTDTGAGTTEITHNGNKVEIANQGIDRYDHYNLIGEFEIKLDDESNYDIITNDITTGKIVTDKVLRLKAGVDKEIDQVDNPNSTAPHKYTTAITDKAVDSYLEEEYKEYLIPVEGEENKYRTEDNWLVEVDPDNPQNMKVSTPIGAKKGENLTLAVTHLFTNGSEKNFLMNFVVKEESIEKPNYKVAVTEAGEEVTNTPTNEYTKIKPKPVKYELESTSIVDDNGNTWTLSIDENTGVITATAPGEIDDKVSTINAPVIATYVDQNLKDINGKDLVYTERSNATFTATAPQEGEVRYSQDNIIEYETIVRYNPDKDPTESGVVQEGKNGKSTADYTVTYKNGEVVAGPTMVEGTEKVTVKPTDQIFEIGTKGASVDVTAPDEQTIKIPYTTEIIYDENQPVGYRKETPGEDGEKKITYEITQKDGKATVTAKESTTKEVTPRKIIIGTKPSELDVDFNPEIDVKVDNTKEVGSVDTEVVQGEYKTVTKNVQNPDGSIVTIEEVVEITKPKQIITVGTKDYTGDVSHTDKKDVPFEVKYEYTDQLDAGVTELKNDGVLGEKTVTYTVPVVNGKKDPNKEVTSEETQTKDPVDKVILVGTRPVEKTIEIPFETEYVYDSNLEVGQTVTDENNPGVTGQKKVTTSFNQTTNDIEVTEETVTEAQKRIVRVGGKTTGSQTLTEKVPFTVEIRENPALNKGEYKVIQDGVVGEKEKILTIENSTVTNTAEGRTITEAKNQIIEVGSADFTGEVTHEVTEEIPFTVRIVEDSTMAPGTSRIETKGQAGSKTTRYTQNIVNGAADGELKSEEIVTDTIKAPVEEVIHVGTAPVNSENTSTSGDIPVDITYTYDPTKERGTAEKGVFTPGKVETKIVNQYNPATGKIETKTEETVTNAKQEIIVGTKDYTGTFTHEETKVTPFETQIVHDPTLKAGETVTDQTGVNGVETRTITQKFTNGEIAEKSYSDWTQESAVQNEIIRVGSLTEGTKKHEEAIPFDYKVEYDPTIPAGEYKITQEGKDGKRTTEWTIRNSQVVGEPTVTEEAPVNAIIKVGNKDFTGLATHTETFTIPYKVVIRENSELPVGTRKTVQEGADGSYKITYKQDIKNGDTVGELTRTESDRVEAKDQIIEIGTKPVDPKVDNYNYEVQPEIDYVYDSTLPKGTVEKGKTTPGEVKTVITTTRDPQTGELVTKEEKIVTPARQEIRVGTKDYTGEVKYTERVYEDYKTTIIQDPNLAADQQVVEKQGVVGIKEREVTRTITNGTASNPSYGDYTTIAEKQDQVIRVGTKTDGTHTVTEELPFTYSINEVDTLEKGQYEVVTEGKKGSRTTEYRIENSKVVEGSANVTEETKPTNAVINVGTGTLEGSHTLTETEVIPFETTIEFDDSLAAGEQRVVTEGQNGSKSREVTLTIEDGKVVNIETGEYEEKKAPVNKVIKVGSLTEGEIEHSEEIPFSYDITYDPTLKAGEVKTDVEGKVGTKTTYYIVKNSEVKKTYEDVVNPTNAKIRVGTKDYTGTITHTEEEAIPYKVEVRENPEMLLGTSKTVTEGVAGTKEVTYNIPVINGEQDTTKEVTSSEKVTTQPIDQVIEVGTKSVDPVEKDVSAEVGVEVEIVNDPELDLGKTRTGELVPGKVENVVTTVYNPATGKMETREDKVVTPAKQIIYVGTKDLVGDQEFVVTQPVPFETEYIEDPNLEAGKTEIKQQGQTGEKTVTYKAEAKNGTVTSHNATEEITKEPVKQIIRVGTKSEETDTKVVVESIPFEIEYEYTDELEAGKIEVKQEGELGEKTITTTTTTINGVSTTDTKEETTKEAVNRVVRVGTKIDRQTTDVVGEETTIIPYKTTVIYDPNLKAGEKVVDKVGVNGERKITVTVPVVDGVAKDPVVKTEDIKPAVDEIIRVGTRDDSTTTVLNTTTTTESIAFTTRYVEDETLDIGQTVVETPGQFGSKTVTTSTILINGEAKTSTSDNVTKEPVDQVVRVGTKVPKLDNQTVTETKDIEVPYSTIIQYNDKMDVGSSFIAQEGKNGTTTITTTVNVVDGVAGKPVITTTTNDPTTRIVQVGTRPVTETVTSTVEFETKVIFDDTLPIGEERVEKGELGEDTTTITHELVDGKIVASTNTTRTKEPKKQIIRVGTKPAELADQNIEDTRTIEIPYTTRIIYDDTLSAGTERVEVEGKNGKRVITYNVEVRDGIATDAKIVDETTTEPTEKVIRVGTRRTDTITTVVETVKPFETKIVYDKDMPKGTYEVTQEGKNGIRRETIVSTRINGVDQENPAVTISETDAIDQIITVGTKCDDQVATIDTEVEKVTPLEVEIVYDDTLAKGVEVVLREGQNGIVKETHTVTVTNGVAGESSVTKTEKVQDKVNKIIRVGTKVDPEVSNNNTIKETEIETIPFETKFIYTDELAAGETEVLVEGKNGKRIYKYTETDTNGSVDKDRSEVIENPVTQIIRVGINKASQATKTTFTKTETIPYEYQFINDPNMEAGTYEVVQEGRVGEKSITYTLVDSVIQDDKTVETTIRDPQDLIIRIGTKKTTNTDNPVKPSKPAEPTVTKIRSEIPYNTIFIYDDSIEAGKKIVTSPGQKGEKIVTITSRLVNGEIVTETSEVILKEARTEYVRVGTKAPDYNGEDVVTKETRVLVPFETEIIYDENLPIGETVVVSEGRDGIQVITITTRYENGVAVETTTDGYVLREAKNRVIRVGTKTNGGSASVDQDTGIIDIPSKDDGDHIVVIPEGTIDDDDQVVVTPEETIDGDDHVAVIPEGDTKEEDTDNDIPQAEVETDQEDEETTDVREDKNSKEEVDRTDESRESGFTNDERELGSDYFRNDASESYRVSDDKSDYKDAGRSAGESDNPKTGITGTASTLTALGISLAGLGFSKKKKEDDEE